MGVDAFVRTLESTVEGYLFMRVGVCILHSLLFGMLMPVAAHAQECQSYVGQTVHPTSIVSVLERFAGMTPRGEFESTAEFEARRAALAPVDLLIIGKVPDSDITRAAPSRGDYFVYDADRQVMRVRTYAFDNMTFYHDDIFGYGGPLDSGRHVLGSRVVDVVINETERVVGTYRGTNAFGVSAQVRRVSRTVNAIYERELSATGGLFPSVGPDQVVVEIAMSPTEGRRLKTTMGVAFVVVPQEPFVASRTRDPIAPTTASPIELTITTRVLFADIRCALVTDPSGVVLASILTN